MIKWLKKILCKGSIDSYTFFCLLNQRDIKLKLRPLESLTDEEKITMLEKVGIKYSISGFQNERKKWIKFEINRALNDINVIEYLNSIHIDYQDLIGQGLAVELIKGE